MSRYPVVGQACECGGTYSNGLRYSVVGAPAAVVVCLTADGEGCGREYPPLAACCRRPHVWLGAFETYCRKCLRIFRTEEPKARYCSTRCETRAGVLVLPEERAV